MAERKHPSGRGDADVVTLLLVDDHPMWRDTLRKVLEHGGAARVVAEANDGAEAIERARDVRPDVVIMDIALPGVDGVEATRAIVEFDPDVRVLALSSSDDPPQVIATIRAGAAGYLLKTATPAQLTDAVDRIHRGEAVLPPTLSGVVLGVLRGADPTDDLADEGEHPALERLTPREGQVLELIAEGRSNRAIAEALSVAPKSVEAYVRSIYTKLDLEPVPDDNRRVLAVLAYLGA
ncbi:MAG: response regulator transcription factor [Actinobacteria bacterium]|nr:response regulator transcription factor [Actinomycetota bacterium]